MSNIIVYRLLLGIYLIFIFAPIVKSQDLQTSVPTHSVNIKNLHQPRFIVTTDTTQNFREITVTPIPGVNFTRREPIIPIIEPQKAVPQNPTVAPVQQSPTEELINQPTLRSIEQINQAINIITDMPKQHQNKTSLKDKQNIHFIITDMTFYNTLTIQKKERTPTKLGTWKRVIN